MGDQHKPQILQVTILGARQKGCDKLGILVAQKAQGLCAVMFCPAADQVLSVIFVCILFQSYPVICLISFSPFLSQHKVTASLCSRLLYD